MVINKLVWKDKLKSTIRWFVVREKHCSFAEKVRLIRQVFQLVAFLVADVEQECANKFHVYSSSIFFFFPSSSFLSKVQPHIINWVASCRILQNRPK
jgi:hypothetical protein